MPRPGGPVACRWSGLCTLLERFGVRLAPMPTPPPPPPAPPSRPRRWLRRFDTLGVKLFLAIGGANVVLVMAAYLVHGWSFDKGLVA